MPRDDGDDTHAHGYDVDAMVGTVADEAAKLLESLRRAASEAARAAADEGAEESARTADAQTGATGESEQHPDDATGSQARGGPRSGGAAREADPSTGAGGHADHARMGEAQSCAYCPLCRAVSVVRSVSPETLERVADLALVAATVLTDVAASRSNASDPAGGQRFPGATRGGNDSGDRGTARNEPVVVLDEED